MTDFYCLIQRVLISWCIVNLWRSCCFWLFYGHTWTILLAHLFIPITCLYYLRYTRTLLFLVFGVPGHSSHFVDAPTSSRTRELEMSGKARGKETPPPEGYQYVSVEYWESCSKTGDKDKPVNGHTGVYAYHCDDCWCSMGGWPCNRDGCVWSCCGQAVRYCRCPKEGDSKKWQTLIAPDLIVLDRVAVAKLWQSRSVHVNWLFCSYTPLEVQFPL